MLKTTSMPASMPSSMPNSIQKHLKLSMEITQLWRNHFLGNNPTHKHFGNYLHHKSHHMVLKFFRINIEPLQTFLEICGVWSNFWMDGTSFILTRIEINSFCNFRSYFWINVEELLDHALLKQVWSNWWLLWCRATLSRWIEQMRTDFYYLFAAMQL